MTWSDAFDAVALTDTGLVRPHNEDSSLSRPDLGLFVVADGMGGHAAGDFASRTIVEAAASVGLASSLDDLLTRFLERVTQAHQHILIRGDELGGTVGATVVALMVADEGWACAWSGDSRLYLLRDGVLQQLSRDHTEVADLVTRGVITPAEARTWPRRNVITRAVGVGPDPNCDLIGGEVAVGDVFLLCSDGLTEHVTDEMIADHLSRDGDAAAMGRALIDDTLAGGATDNVTCLVVRVLAPPVVG